jgi:multicomponent K+:H+ antiporter subunit F
MSNILINFCEIIVLIALLIFLIQMIKSKKIPDRILAFESIILCIVSLIILHCATTGSSQYLELILTVSALGFIGTTATVYYWQQRINTQKEEQEKKE